MFYCTLVSNVKGNVTKSNKSELWNRLSYRGLPYHFEVRRKSVRNDCKISRSQPQKFDLNFHSTSTTSKGLTENSKRMSWDNPVFSIDTKNSIGFIVHFFWVRLDLQVIVYIHPRKTEGPSIYSWYIGSLVRAK